MFIFKLVLAILLIVSIAGLLICLKLHIQNKRVIIPLLVIIGCSTTALVTVVTLNVYTKEEPTPEVQEVTNAEFTEDDIKALYEWETPLELEHPEALSDTELFDAISTPLLQFNMENDYPLATSISQTWTNMTGFHCYAQTIFGTQVYECLLRNNTLYINFYGSSFHKGFKGIIYGSQPVAGLNIDALEQRLISMGLNDFFTIVEVTDTDVTLESRESGTHTLRL